MWMTMAEVTSANHPVTEYAISASNHYQISATNLIIIETTLLATNYNFDCWKLNY